MIDKPEEPKIHGRTGEQLGLLKPGDYDCKILEVSDMERTQAKGTPFVRLKVDVQGAELFTFLSGSIPTLRVIEAVRKKLVGQPLRIRVTHEEFRSEMHERAQVI